MTTYSLWTKTLTAAILACGLFATPPLAAGAGTQPAASEEFFIISSVDGKNQQIVLKRPTEVTELVEVNQKTVYQDEDEKAIEFKNLRAGDTVWVSFAKSSGGIRIAARVRKGPMTIEELHRRYVAFQ
jgi:hypothetical protein